MPQSITRRKVLKTSLAGSLAYGLSALSVAQTVPETARIIVGFPPGGAPDLIARRLAEPLTGKLARAVIVDNRPGAAGRIAVDIARQSPADGTTLLINPAGVLTINPHSYKKLTYDPFKDLTPVSLAAYIDFGFAVGPAVPAEVKNVADFVKWAKANSGKVNYGSPAAGSPTHFVGDALSRSQGLDMTHVPYRGGVAVLNDLMGGQLSVGILTLGDMVQHDKAGKLRLLASTGKARSRFTPGLPTFTEQKIAGLELSDWTGVYVAGTPSAEVMARIAPLVAAVTASASFAQALAASSLEAASSTPEELDRMARADFEKWGPIVRASGFVADV